MNYKYILKKGIMGHKESSLKINFKLYKSNSKVRIKVFSLI